MNKHQNTSNFSSCSNENYNTIIKLGWDKLHIKSNANFGIYAQVGTYPNQLEIIYANIRV